MTIQRRTFIKHITKYIEELNNEPGRDTISMKVLKKKFSKSVLDFYETKKAIAKQIIKDIASGDSPVKTAKASDKKKNPSSKKKKNHASKKKIKKKTKQKTKKKTKQKTTRTLKKSKKRRESSKKKIQKRKEQTEKEIADLKDSLKEIQKEINDAINNPEIYDKEDIKYLNGEKQEILKDLKKYNIKDNRIEELEAENKLLKNRSDISSEELQALRNRANISQTEYNNMEQAYNNLMNRPVTPSPDYHAYCNYFWDNDRKYYQGRIVSRQHPRGTYNPYIWNNYRDDNGEISPRKLNQLGECVRLRASNNIRLHEYLDDRHSLPLIGLLQLYNRFARHLHPRTGGSKYHDALGISENASPNTINKKYKKLAKKYHPDRKNGNEEKFKKINKAKQVLLGETNASPITMSEMDDFIKKMRKRKKARGKRMKEFRKKIDKRKKELKKNKKCMSKTLAKIKKSKKYKRLSTKGKYKLKKKELCDKMSDKRNKKSKCMSKTLKKIKSNKKYKNLKLKGKYKLKKKELCKHLS